MTNSVKEESVEVDGCPIHLRRAGSGETILFLHGAHGVGTWNPFFQLLAQDAALIVPDHPGFGRSQPRGLVETVADLAYVYLDLIAQLGLKNVHLVGHCIGGWAALEMAVRSPGAIARLSLVNSAGVSVPEVRMGDFFIATPERLPGLLFADPARGAALLDAEFGAIDDATLHANRVMAARLSWSPRLFDPALERWLRRIGVPTTVVWGRSNRILPPAYGERLRERIPKARLAVIESCGHLAYLEQPAAVAQAILTSGRQA